MTHHLYPFSDERSYFFDSMYDHNRLCHGSKTFFRQPNKDQVQLESMFTKIQVLLSVTLGAEVHSVPLNQSAIFKKIQVFTILLPLIFIFATILLPTYLQVNCWLANSKSTNQIILVFTSKSSMSTQLQNHNTQLLFQFITFNISEFNNCQLKSVSFQKCCGANCYKNLYLALLRK